MKAAGSRLLQHGCCTPTSRGGLVGLRHRLRLSVPPSSRLPVVGQPSRSPAAAFFSSTSARLKASCPDESDFAVEGQELSTSPPTTTLKKADRPSKRKRRLQPTKQVAVDTAPEEAVASTLVEENSPMHALNLVYYQHYQLQHSNANDGGSTTTDNHLPADAGPPLCRSHMKVTSIPPPSHVPGGPTQYWTAVLHCPLSGNVWGAGRLRGDPSYLILPQDNNDSNSSNQPPTIMVVAYSKKSTAQQAAAARALDWWRFEEAGQLEPRLCEEDPLQELSDLTTITTTRVQNPDSYVSALSVLEEVETGLENEEDEEGAASDDDDEDDDDTEAEDSEDDNDDQAHIEESLIDQAEADAHRKPDAASFMTANGEEEGKDDDDEEEEESSLLVFDETFDDEGLEYDQAAGGIALNPEEKFVLYTPPVQSSRMTPAQSVLNALSNHAATSVAKPLHLPAASAGRLVEKPEHVAGRTLKWAKGWLEAELKIMASATEDASEGGRLILRAPSKSNILGQAKSVLRCLAESQNEIAPGQRLLGLQTVAFGIIKLLWRSDDAKPDADAYAHYLQCLDGLDGKSVAYKAEAILEKMIGGKSSQGYEPPPPNTNVHNTVLQMFIQWGAKKEEVDRILSRFTPNHETYWILLSSHSYVRPPNEIFDPESPDIKKCIEQLRTSENFEKVRVRDVDVLNAPLKCGGWLRRNATRIPWSQSQIYRGGFKDFDESRTSIQKARAAQEWVEANPYLDSSHADIASYEAVIQEWTRTATRKGLRHAEEIVDKLLAEPVSSCRYPRLATFHPILHAWLNSNSPENAERLRDWTDKIFAAAKISDRIALDARVYELALLARRFIISKQVNAKDDDSKLDALERAKESSAILEEFCHRALTSCSEPEGPIFLSLWEPFVHAINAWRLCLVEKSDDETLAMVLTETKHAMDLFEKLLVGIYELDRSTCMYTNGQLSNVMEQMVDNSQRVYVMYQLVMETIARKKGHSLTREHLSSILLEMDSRLRKVGELNFLFGQHYAWKESMEGLSKEVDHIFADHFDYEVDLRAFPRAVASAETRPALLWQTLHALNALVEHDSIPMGDLVRLCRLMSHMSQSWNFRTNKFHEELTLVLDKVMPPSHNRDTLVDSVPLDEKACARQEESTKKSAKGTRPKRVKKTKQSKRPGGRKLKSAAVVQ